MKTTNNNKRRVLKGLLFAGLVTLLGSSAAFADNNRGDNDIIYGDFVAETSQKEVVQSERVVDVKVMDEFGNKVFDTTVSAEDLMKQNFQLEILPENSVFLLMYENTAYYYLNGGTDAALYSEVSAKR